MDYSAIRAVISILSFIILVIGAIAGYLAFRKITSNHLHHLDEDVKALTTDVKTNTANIANIDKNVAIIATKLECKIEKK